MKALCYFENILRWFSNRLPFMISQLNTFWMMFIADNPLRIKWKVTCNSLTLNDNLLQWISIRGLWILNELITL